MCTISDKITFCTCTAGNVEEMQHYWILYRRSSNKDNMVIVGEPISTFHNLLPAYEENKSLLGRRLNDIDAFDKPILFKEQDRMEIVLFNGMENQMMFSYFFQNGTWQEEEPDIFELMSTYNENKSGTFKQVL